MACLDFFPASKQFAQRLAVTDDLLALVQHTLDSLQDGCLTSASDHMNRLFMEIAGSSPDFGPSVFREVRITPKYAIEISSGDYNRTLNPDQEVNGANKRALTLSFIWGLMEAAEVPAPRFIDTPLGMISSGVKRRLVDLLSTPSSNDFQIILLMTRSEIRDVEDLLDARAGSSQTLSCSAQFPVDLVNDWKRDQPVILACACNHRESCDVCARKDDHSYQLTHRA